MERQMKAICEKVPNAQTLDHHRGIRCWRDPSRWCPTVPYRASQAGGKAVIANNVSENNERSQRNIDCSESAAGDEQRQTSLVQSQVIATSAPNRPSISPW